MPAPVYNIPEGLFGVVVFGSVGLLAIAVIVILYIFVQESRRGGIW